MFKILHAARQKMKQNWKMVYLGRWKRETGLKLFFHTASTWGGKMMTQVLCFVAQSCPSLCDPMDCSPTGTSVHGDSPSHSTGVGCHAFLQGIFLTQESNWGLLHGSRMLYWLSYQGSPYNPRITTKSPEAMIKSSSKKNKRRRLRKSTLTALLTKT